MHIYNVRELVEFDEAKFLPKVLMNRPGYRLVLLNLRAGQSFPEHATKEVVTVYAISGHVTFYEKRSPFEMRAGHVLFIDGGAPHALEAREDSTLLVVAAGSPVAAEKPELDLREVPRPQRHPQVFAKFDALPVGEWFELVNDHDPVPLQRQMQAMRPDQAEWSYVERGPDVFRIRVRRVAPLSGPSSAAPVQPDTLLGTRR
ncbi:MAG: DUF2249 domain-containing protein [Terracidiphilus sp.]